MTDLDPALWVRLRGSQPRGPQTRWIIAGNADTHRGHFTVVDLADDVSRSVSKRDIAESSPDAARWIEGFLAGQQPSLYEFLGTDDGLFDACTDDDLARWREWCRRFRADGVGLGLSSLPPRDVILTGLWVVVGGQFRTFDGEQWAALDPQPGDAIMAWAWPGSLCEERRHCSVVELLDRYLVCEDCREFHGELSAVPPQ